MKPWANRIVGHGEEDPEQLLANPGNWRIHPQFQQDALRGAIKEVGFIRSVTVNRTTGHVVDGHLRVLLAMRADEKSISVEYIEISEEEERKALATLDPIAAMAVPDDNALSELIDEISFESAALQELMEQQRDLYSLGEGEEIELDEEEKPLVEQAVQLRPQREYCVIVCETEEEWSKLQEVLSLEPRRKGGYKTPEGEKMGIQRVLPAAGFFEILEG